MTWLCFFICRTRVTLHHRITDARVTHDHQVTDARVTHGQQRQHGHFFCLVSEVAGDAEAAVPFTEAFILCQVQPGEYYVANQVHRTLA
eukprot:462705-Pelagomonas_calceolata.AAC.3